MCRYQVVAVSAMGAAKTDAAVMATPSTPMGRHQRAREEGSATSVTTSGMTKMASGTPTMWERAERAVAETATSAMAAQDAHPLAQRNNVDRAVVLSTVIYAAASAPRTNARWSGSPSSEWNAPWYTASTPQDSTSVNRWSAYQRPM
jgi:hypothetical protein